MLRRISSCCLCLIAFGAFGAEPVFDLKLAERKAPIGLELQGRFENTQTNSLVTYFKGWKHQTNEVTKTQLLTRWQLTAKHPGSESIQLVIERFVQSEGTNTEELLPTNCVVIGKTIGGEKLFSSDTVQISEKAGRALRMLAPLHGTGHGGCTDAEFLNVTGPKRIGETWPVGTECIRRMMKESAIAMDPDRIEATAKLAGIEEHDQEQCYRIEISIKAHSTTVPKPLLKDQKLAGCQFSAVSKFDWRAVVLLPVDPQLPLIGGQNGGEFRSHIKIVRNGKSGTAELSARIESSADQKRLK